jgi:glutamyl-tRNA synthetase
MRETADEELLDALLALLPHLEGGQKTLAVLQDDTARGKLMASMAGLKERAKTLIELNNSAQFLFAARPVTMEDKAQAILDDGGREVLAALKPQLEAAGAWEIEPLEQIVRDFAEQNDLKLGKVAQPLRAALTGSTQSPPVFDVLAVLGRDEALARIADAST